MICLVERHVRLLLEAPFLAEAARRRHARQIARSGRRVVEGVLTSGAGWELRDWLTGAVVARGSGGWAGLESALTGEYQVDDLFDDVPGPEVVTPGLPASLGQAIEEWVFAPTTGDHEIAEFVGWPVGKVREYR